MSRLSSSVRWAEGAEEQLEPPARSQSRGVRLMTESAKALARSSGESASAAAAAGPEDVAVLMPHPTDISAGGVAR